MLERSVIWLALMPLTACAPPAPHDLDGRPVPDVRLIGSFDGGTLAVQQSHSPARVLVELLLDEESADASSGVPRLQVSADVLLLPTRLLRDRLGCDASTPRGTSGQASRPDDAMPGPGAGKPCLMRIRAEFFLPWPPTASDSLSIIMRDARALPVRWLR